MAPLVRCVAFFGLKDIVKIVEGAPNSQGEDAYISSRLERKDVGHGGRCCNRTRLDAPCVCDRSEIVMRLILRYGDSSEDDDTDREIHNRLPWEIPGHFIMNCLTTARHVCSIRLAPASRDFLSWKKSSPTKRSYPSRAQVLR